MDLRFYWSLLLRRLPIMLSLFLICATFGAVTAVRKPPTYTTSARLLIEAPTINDGLGLGYSDSGEQLQIIENQLMTRANLVDIANKYRVLGAPGRMASDIVAQAMRAHTRVIRSSGRGQATMLELRFIHTDPQIAASVVNEYVTLVLRDNSRDRIGRAESALEFYRQEAQSLSAELDRLSGKIVEFKNQNSEALPENLRYRQDRQVLLQERLARLERDRNDMQRQKQEIISQFESTGRLIATNDNNLTPEQAQVQRLQLELQELLSVYNDSSPRVKAMRNRLAAAERQAEAAAANIDTTSGESGPATLMEITISEIDTRIASAEADIVEVNKELARLEESINATSANAITLAALERERESTQLRYDQTETNLNTALRAERLQTSDRGQQITVIESASVPTEPSGPNRKMIALSGIGLGLGLAGGFFLLMEFLNRSIRRPAELQNRFDITPIAVIPFIEGRAQKIRRRALRLGLILAVLTLLPAALWYIHNYYMPLDILTQKVLDRVGIR